MAVTFNEISVVDNGARFFTADLHVHSFGGSDDVSDAGMTVTAIIEAAVKHKVAILAVTDHNTSKNTAESIDYGAKYADRLMVLPGVEITTGHGHLLAYFAPERADCVGKLLVKIDLVGAPGARDSHTKKSMADVIAEVERLGGVAIAAHVDRAKTGFETILPGYPNWKRDIITAPGLYGLEFDDPSHLVWYSPEDEPTANGAERKKLQLARSNAPATAARLRLAACQNSDAHTMAEFVSQHSKRVLTRLKMNELSFEGFRTALIDPEARVRATATIPLAIPRVLGMQVAGGFLDGCTFHFSDNLNCLIGGRGTGKSTAIQGLAYGLGLRNDFEEHDNCPDNSIVYCEDADGVRYRYERIRGQEPSVQAKEDQSIKDVPADAFRVEFYGQGELAEVAKDPLRNPALLQEFLDKHITLDDLTERETELVSELQENSAQLIPLEATAAQLGPKTVALNEVNKKIQIAETGKLKEIASFQSHLAAEKALYDSLKEVQTLYENGMSLSNFLRNYDELLAAAGTVTGDKECSAILEKAKEVIEAANGFLKTEEVSTNTGLKKFGQELSQSLSNLAAQHKRLDSVVNQKIAGFQKQGLSGDLKGFNNLVKQRTALTVEIARIKGQKANLDELRKKRVGLLADLAVARETMMTRRKSQLKAINQNLRATIDDYSINLYYDAAGITDNFKDFVVSAMHGTYFQEEMASAFCERITPHELAPLVVTRDAASIAKIGDIGTEWAQQVIRQLQTLTRLHELETISKPPKPVIKVLTKGSAPRQIPMNQLSDGQKHTILLTIAMLAESNLPLIIDQPEDDLDNAFVFKSVVSTLRTIKERRQVILVTHNANIAVLGDSELILPMKKSGESGDVFDRGSVDRAETRKAVQDILEGGETAFRRRKEIYGY
ncbi:MAG: AAA family ATPase [Acidobacteria bacterium]|nr:AAA family ATPase [Acidobacteriota bacterium]